MCATSYEPESLKDAFYRGAMALQDMLELPYEIKEGEFWDNATIQEQFELFVDDLNNKEEGDA